MDPNAALFALIDAALMGDADAVRNSASDLAGWLDAGGRNPTAEKFFAITSTRLGFGEPA
jgi:hypothetical protein